MSDPFENFIPGLESPAADAFEIVPNDGADLEKATRGFYVGTLGTVKVELVGSSAPVTFTNLAPGVLHPLRVKRVYASGTTSKNMIGIL